MAKTDKFVDSKGSKNGEFSAHINKEANELLTIYCRVNGYNKTQYVTNLVLMDMHEKFSALKEANNG